MKETNQTKCPPCDGGTKALKGEALRKRAAALSAGWQVTDEKILTKDLAFKDFRQALDYTNKVGNLAEEIGHHPDIFLAWGKVKLTIFTHSVGGLTENDFDLAARIDKLA